MKIATKLMVLTMMISMMAVAAWAQAPITGVYATFFNNVFEGIYAESFAAPDGYLTIGNAMVSASWDGAAFGTQWSISCPAIDAAPAITEDLRDPNGTGNVRYTKTFSGGTIFLNGTGEAWGGGDATYTGVVTSFTELVAVQYVENVRVGVTGTVTAKGTVDGYPSSCVTMTYNTVDLIPGDKPNDYPDYVSAPSCTADRSDGRWGNAQTGVFISVGACQVPTENATWGQIKALYE